MKEDINQKGGGRMEVMEKQENLKELVEKLNFKEKVEVFIPHR